MRHSLARTPNECGSPKPRSSIGHGAPTQQARQSAASDGDVLDVVERSLRDIAIAGGAGESARNWPRATNTTTGDIPHAPSTSAYCDLEAGHASGLTFGRRSRGSTPLGRSQPHAPAPRRLRDFCRGGCCLPLWRKCHTGQEIGIAREQDLGSIAKMEAVLREAGAAGRPLPVILRPAAQADPRLDYNILNLFI